MKIKSYKKIKNNTYRISFFNKEQDILLYDDVILKHNLLLRNEITKKELDDILEENSHFSCYYKALNYLTYKKRSKKEIKDYLKKQKFFSKDIDAIIKKLEEKNLINDQEYLKSFVSEQINIFNSGPAKIMKKLKDLGFAEDIINEELNKIPFEIWNEKLEKVIIKKINANKKDGINKIKEKIIYSCINEGFLKEDVVSILNRMDIPKNDDSLKKEAEKLYKRLSSKYNGEELFYQIKGRLFNKGFSFDDIDCVLNDIK